MTDEHRISLDQVVRHGAELLRQRRLAEEAVRGRENARLAGRTDDLGRGPGEGDPVPPRTGGFVHVDIPADDPERAARFYATAFGWQATPQPGPVPYWLLGPQDGSGVGAGIGRREHPGQTPVATIEVDSAADAARRVVAAGGAILGAPAIMPGVGTLVRFRDPEGNVLSMLEPSPDAPGAALPPV